MIQFRINAENPSHNFAPSPGRLEYYLPPGGPHVRVDSACYSGYMIPPNYDSMIAKLIVKGRDREEAIAIGKACFKRISYWRSPFHDPFSSIYAGRSSFYQCRFRFDIHRQSHFPRTPL